MKINFCNVGIAYRTTIKQLLKKAVQKLEQNPNIEISISFLTEDEIKVINNSQRGIDSVTDVLSFPYLQLKPFEKVNADNDQDKNPRTGNVLMGDIMICPVRAQQQAIEYGHTLKREISFLALHGFLHLCGFDHLDQQQEEQMTATAESILQSLKITR